MFGSAKASTFSDTQQRRLWLLQQLHRQQHGVMLQLGQRSSDRDVWLWVPAGTSHNQASPWTSATSLSHWRECNELHLISSLPPQDLQLISNTADFIRHFPPMSAVGARQHPQQAPLLSGSGGGGGTGGGGETDEGPKRPATGLLWPRHS